MPSPVVPFVVEAARAAGFDPPALEDGDLASWFASEAETCPDVGLRVAASARFHAANPVVYLMMSSATVGEGFAGLQRFSLVLQGRRSGLRVAPMGERVALLWRAPGSSSPPWTDFVALVLVRIAGWLAGEPLSPVGVTLVHDAPVDLGAHRAWLGLTPEFAARENAVIFSAADWASPSQHANPDLHRLHLDFLTTLRDRLGDEALVAELKTLLVERLGSASLDLHEVAPTLAMSPRTLQRRLTERGRSYSELVDEVRRERVEELLSVSDASLEAIALHAGFTSSRALSRAFKRWTGSTPGAWRAAR